MKFFLIIIFSFQISKISFCQLNHPTIHQIAYDYLVKSDSIKKGITSVITTNDIQECKEIESLFYVCPSITFLNLAGYKSLLMSFPGDLGIQKCELSDRVEFKDKYYFNSFNDKTLTSFNRKNGRYCLYITFSKLIGRILPLIIFKNEFSGIENPCEDLLSIKFGNAVVVFLIFNHNFSAVEASYHQVVQMN